MQWLSATALAALLVWATAIYTTSRYLRSRSDAYIAAYWRAQIFLALALTVSVPAVYVWIDTRLGIANASRWIANVLILVAGYFLDGFHVAMTHGDPDAWRAHRWAILYLMLTVAAMAWLLWRANLPVESVTLELSQVNTALILYRVVFLAFFAFVTVRLIRSSSHYLAVATDTLIRLSTQAVMIGGYWGIVYIVATLAVVMLPGRSWAHAFLLTLVNLAIFAAVACLLIGVNLVGLGQRIGLLTAIQHLRYLRTYWQLRPLWQMLTARVPEVVLPTSITWYAALLRPQDMEFLLHRRVIEILDAWRVVDGTPAAAISRHPAPPAGTTSHIDTVVDQDPPAQVNVRHQAKTDAYHLRAIMASRIGRRPESDSEGDQTIADYRPDTYAEQVLYLEAVARALRPPTWNPRLILDCLIAKGRHVMSKHQLRSTGHDERGNLSSVNAETAPDRADRFARLVSEVANPLFVALPTFLIVALHTAPNWQRGVLWWLVTTIGISAAPFLFVYQGVRQGRYSDHHLSMRSQRLIPLIVGLACAAVALVLLLALQASRELLTTIAAVLVCGVFTFVITTRWKISFHLIGAAGATTVITLLFGPIGLVLIPFVALVGWARWQVHAHTVAQAIAGTALAVVIAVGMFHVFGLI